MRTTSGLGSGISTGGPTTALSLSVASPSTNPSAPIFGHRRSSGRLPSLADGASGASGLAAPTSSAGGPHPLLGRPHRSRNWAVRAYSSFSANAVGARALTTAPRTAADPPTPVVSLMSLATVSETTARADLPASVVSASSLVSAPRCTSIAPILASALGRTATNSSHAAHPPLLPQGRVPRARGSGGAATMTVPAGASA